MRHLYSMPISHLFSVGAFMVQYMRTAREYYARTIEHGGVCLLLVY